MNQEDLEYIREIAGKNPETFKLTLAVLGRRDHMIEDIERLGECHDSLVSQCHINFAQSLENCDLMLHRVFGTEIKKYETVFNIKPLSEDGRTQFRERLSLEYQVQSAI